ncbi:hypothetical protein [Pseudoalteromonas byunsanensis]|uniref:Uncharacterized protein n=1 Tax=Pseudoalteromonas byunsanensis TaxID=327939 RepID=A0A1S1NCK7_9GAMM|nr:hypothetical protein [Pseudoalteromonas byunsanensis]OHU97526.1 hypothetical protein BIW53_01825 [Pseudoalteromonas byunsanensis]
MRTVDLTVNWPLYSVFLTLCFGLFALSSMLEGGTNTLSMLCYALLTITLVPLFLTLSDKRFVHIDKAGVSYSLGLGTYYIHSDDIVRIQRKSFSLLTLIQVQMKTGKVRSFYSWTLSAPDFIRAEQLLASK